MAGIIRRRSGEQSKIPVLALRPIEANAARASRHRLVTLSGLAPCSGQFESGPSSTPAGSRSSVTDRWAIEWQVQPSSIASAVPGSGNNDDGVGTVRGGMARSYVPVFILGHADDSCVRLIGGDSDNVFRKALPQRAGRCDADLLCWAARPFAAPLSARASIVSCR